MLLAGAGQAQAQTAVLTGVVRSEFGDPLEGANVIIADLALSVSTNAAGRYTLTLPADRVKGQTVTLMARAIGYKAMGKSMVLSAGPHTNDFSLTRDINRLSDVVVTGVSGATETKKLAFAVAHVDEKDMPVPGANPLSQIQGKVSGANIVSGSGRPGAAPAIILRAPQSLNASGRSQEPLLIIDGAISSGSIADINPQDIASVEIVKGAAASSIYGSRAGNGVIQITTRSGKNGPEGVRFHANTEYGVSSIEKTYKYPLTNFMTMDPTYTRFCVKVTTAQSCSRTVDIGAETFRINDGAVYNPLTPVQFENDGGISSNPGFANLHTLFQTNPYPQTYNPINALLTNGANLNTTFDATGKVGQTSFFTSINQFRQEGGIRFLSGYRRTSLRLNVDQQLPGNLSFSIHSAYNDIVDHNNGIGWLALTRQPANANLLARDTQGRLFLRTVPQRQGSQNVNPAYDAANTDPVDKIGRYLADATLRWAPLTWFDADYTFGYDGRSNFAENQTDKNYLTTGTTQYLGNVSRAANKSYSLNSSVSLTARKSFFGDVINTRTNFRATYEAQDFRSQNSSGDNLAVPGLATENAAITNFSIGSGTAQIRQLGYVAEFAPDFKGRYIATASVRRDAASLFGAAQRWQTYGRGSLAWRIVEEPWFHVPGVSDLKLRASKGQAGNRPRFDAQYETYNIGTGGALSPSALGNKNLKPEITTETELGGDLELWNRVALTITHSYDIVTQQLLPVTPPAAAGFQTQWQNAGTLTNRTWEGSLNVPIILKKNLNYSVRFLADHSTSYITQLDIPEKFYQAAGQQGAETMLKYEKGARIDNIWGRTFVKDCRTLPADFQSRCGAGKDYQANSDGLVVYVGAGNTLADGITKNLWSTAVPAADAPWAGGTDKKPLTWGSPILARDSAGTVNLRKLGHALPDLNWSMSHTLSYKRFSAYGLLNAVVGKTVWDAPRQWSFGDFQTLDGDQSSATVATAKPLGYYFRAASTNGIGGLYDVLGPNNVSAEDASFVKVREVSLGYRIGSVAGVGNWTLTLVGRNLKTFTKYKGFDPEVGGGGGALNSSVLNAVDAFQFPNLRTFSFALSTNF
jgi:TonB-linked SusC/RagA family outer membrane protein